jgi:hypothetical protein
MLLHVRMLVIPLIVAATRLALPPDTGDNDVHKLLHTGGDCTTVFKQDCLTTGFRIMHLDCIELRLNAVTSSATKQCKSTSSHKCKTQNVHGAFVSIPTKAIIDYQTADGIKQSHNDSLT